MPEQCFDVTIAAQHVQDQNVLTFNAVKNDVLSHGKTAQTGTQVFIASASKVGMGG